MHLFTHLHISSIYYLSDSTELKFSLSNHLTTQLSITHDQFRETFANRSYLEKNPAKLRLSLYFGGETLQSLRNVSVCITISYS